MMNEPSVVATLLITPTVSAFAESDRPTTRTDMTMDDLKTNEGVIFCSSTYHVLLPLRGMRFTATAGKLARPRRAGGAPGPGPSEPTRRACGTVSTKQVCS